MGMRKLLSPHAELAVGQSGSTCSLMLCRPHARRYTRMMGRQNLPVLHAPLKIGFPESPCSPVLCEARAFLSHGAAPHTPYWGKRGESDIRLEGMRKLAIRHALPRRAYPNGWNAEAGRLAHGADSWLVREQMFSCFVRFRARSLAESTPDSQGGGSWPPICAEKADLPESVCPPVFS